MRLTNETDYPTKTLRALLVEAHNRLARTEGRLQTWRHLCVEVVYTRRHETSGWAYLRGYTTRLRLARGGVDPASVARLVDHEFQHLYGYKHTSMQCARSSDYHTTEHLERFAWAREKWGEILLEAAPRERPKVDVRATRSARIMERLAAWEGRLRRAERMVKKLRRKARYYEKTMAAAPAGSDAALICRDGEHVERFLNLRRDPRPLPL